MTASTRNLETHSFNSGKPSDNTMRTYQTLFRVDEGIIVDMNPLSQSTVIERFCKSRVLAPARQDAGVLLHLLLVMVFLFSPLFFTVQAVNAEQSGAEPQPVDIIEDIAAGGKSSKPDNLFSIGDTLFFSAYDSEHGYELWRSIPPYNDAWRVEDIYPGTGSSNPAGLTANKDILFFSATDGVNGVELWKSEPPYTSAQLVYDLHKYSGSNPQSLYAIGDAVFFQADDGEHGIELWMTTPPYFSARLVADIYPDGGSSDPAHLTSMGWILFFTANDSQGREVWLSEPPYDQTSTRRLKNIHPLSYDSPEELTLVDTTLFFTADDGTNGMELWKSVPPYDDASTLKVAKYAFLFRSADPYDLQPIGQTLFFTAFINTIGFELWKTVPDYSLTRTSRVDDINPGFFSSKADNKTPIGSTLFFTASDGKQGYELWRTAPPYDSAELVEDIYPGMASGNPADLTVVGTTLFFTARDEQSRQIWKTTPPYLTAEKVTDKRWEPAGSDPENLHAIGRQLFFTAGDLEKGIEVWKLDSGLVMPDTGFAPGRITDIGKQPAGLVYDGSNQISLAVPRLEINNKIIGVPIADDGWNLNWLWDSIGYLDETTFPTLPGNTVLTGHNSLPDGSPGPFARLQEARWGDEIYLFAWGQKYVYQVRSVDLVSQDDRSAFRQESLDWITLITCKDYDETTDAYQSRLVVRAVLVRVEPVD